MSLCPKLEGMRKVTSADDQIRGSSNDGLLYDYEGSEVIVSILARRWMPPMTILISCLKTSMAKKLLPGPESNRREHWPVSGDRSSHSTATRSQRFSTGADKIPLISRRGRYLYNFWRTAGNPKGLWRRTTLAAHMTTEPGLGDRSRLGCACGKRRRGLFWGGASVKPDG